MSTHEGMPIIEPGSISEWVWEEKYRFKPGGDETKGDAHVSGTFMRVARALASVEDVECRDVWVRRFHEVMSSFEFLPAGRIISGAGTGRDTTLSNCFVMPEIPDSLSGIMQAVTDAAMTLRTGGGVGMDFSSIRPRGARVVGLDADASGPVSFMDLWHAMCGTIMSAGARRGAMMGTLRCDHPDIEEFITAKRQGGRLSNFNISVAVTDDFMGKVEIDGEFPLQFGGQVYKTVRAAKLWDTIIRSTYECADPGVVFIDRMNDRNPLKYAEKILSTNPCGEVPLPPGGACLLGSINVARFVRRPFTKEAHVDYRRMGGVIDVAIRLLDNVNDVSHYPLDVQVQEKNNKRRVGLGITGLADALIMLGMRYGSKPAVQFTDQLMRDIAHRAALTSTSIGMEKGSFPLFDREKFPDNPEARRNSHVLSIAPTGTISLLAGNISSGIEPVFSWSYGRNVLQRDGTRRQMSVDDYVVRLAKHLDVERNGDEWVTTDELTVDEHIAMAGAAQKHVDAAISKTINCPASMPFDAFKAVYRKAYDAGLKGCTTFRPNDVTGAILVRTEESAKAVVSEVGSNVVQIGEKLERPETLKGRTYKLKPPGREHALYVTINDVELGGRRRPFEIFFSSKDVDGYAWTVALARMISAVFRKGGDVAFVADELRQVFDPRGGYWADQQYVPSICAGIGKIIDRHMRDTGHLDAVEVTAEPRAGKHCPKCQSGRLFSHEGCWNCDSCDYSKCG